MNKLNMFALIIAMIFTINTATTGATATCQRISAPYHKAHHARKHHKHHTAKKSTTTVEPIVKPNTPSTAVSVEVETPFDTTGPIVNESTEAPSINDDEIATSTTTEDQELEEAESMLTYESE